MPRQLIKDQKIWEILFRYHKYTFIKYINTTFSTHSKIFTVFRNDSYTDIDYTSRCVELIWIPFDIHTRLHSVEQLTWTIQTLHCVSAVRKVLYDSLDIQLPPCYIWDLPILLENSYGYKPLGVDTIQNWDIVFLRKLSRNSLSHIVLWLEQQYVFHACRSRNTLIELFHSLEGEYATI